MRGKLRGVASKLTAQERLIARYERDIPDVWKPTPRSGSAG